ncbi:hypothetical protein BD779DRAFT_1528660 [Infundibulicybe gibba]|nr:hypothetical protein BD779DRAFT_1528660 [Infundibulicybe gibba]
MEAHPAHTCSQLGFDWCVPHLKESPADQFTPIDELLPPHRSISAPFTREECQSLKTLLQSFDQRGETSLRTRTVSKILLRVVCWRQSRLHPNKLRPVEADRSSFRKDFMPACNSTFILATMVYVCLVMTITLCLSQTFTKIAGIGAILFLIFWLGSAAILVTSRSSGRSAASIGQADRRHRTPNITAQGILIPGSYKRSGFMSQPPKALLRA